MAENEVTGLRLVALGSRTRLIGRFLINFDAESKFPPPLLSPPQPLRGSRARKTAVKAQFTFRWEDQIISGYL